MTIPLAPLVELEHLDHLWFQVAGTLCNLTCSHCFISCSPHNHAFAFLTLEEVRRRLEESVAMGVKEYYFTGGEPFLHREMTQMLVETLGYGAVTVLTNATVLKSEWLQTLAAAQEESPYSLEFRVSLDGCSAEMNDPIRGAGTFDRALQGVRLLVDHGFLPIITVARTWPDEQEAPIVNDFLALLRSLGCTRPRLKILPTLKLGAEITRSGGYDPLARVTEELLAGYDRSHLICHHSRIVTNRGIWVCPILLDAADARVGSSLTEAQQPYALSHGACYTCYLHGAICSNPSVGN